MRFIREIALRTMAFFECRDYGLPRRFAARNDILFDTVSANFGAEGIENHCHCEERSDAAIRIPRNAQHCIARRAIKNSPPNRNLTSKGPVAKGMQRALVCYFVP